MPSLAFGGLLALPPWLILAGLLGVINAAACFMLIGRRLGRLAWYAVLGIFAAGLGQVVGTAVHLPEPLKIGDLNVLAASCATWLVVIVARAVGF